MRKAQPPNPHQKGGGGAGGQQKMNNPQYPHQPRGVRPGGPGAGIPNNNNNNKMMNSGGAPPPRRQGIPQQQQNVAPPLVMNNFPTMAEMVGHQMAGNDGNTNRTPYSIICRTPSNPAGAAQQQQQQQQVNDGSGQGATNGSNAGQGPAGQQGQQVTSASPPLMQQGGGGNPQQQQQQPPQQQQQQVSNPQQQQQQGPPHGQHSQQVAPPPHVVMGPGGHSYFMLPPHLMQPQMKIPSHVPGLHPQQPQPPPNSSGSGNQGSNNNVVGGSGGVGQQAGSAGGYQFMMHPADRVVVSGSQHVQAGGPGGPYLPAPFPGNMAGVQGGSGSSGSNAPNAGVVNFNPFGISLHHGSPMVLGNPQAPQGMHHHQLHSTGAGPSAPPMVMPPQQPMGMMMPSQQHPGQSIFMPQGQPAAPMQSKRERKALLITNPNTGEDVVKSMLQEQEKRDGSSGTSSTATSGTSTSATATTSTAGSTRPPGTGITIAAPPRPTASGDPKRGATTGVRISAPGAGVAPATATKETAGADVTPTVSANLDNPDEFLPHLQKAGEAKAKEPIVTPTINGEYTLIRDGWLFD